MNNVIKCKDCIAKIGENFNFIHIFSSKKNNRLYKKKAFYVGFIFYHPKAKQWVYKQDRGFCNSFEALTTIASLLKKLNEGKIICDFEKGEFKL